LAKPPRAFYLPLHSTLTPCSALNAVEGFFAEFTRLRLNFGILHSFVDLQAAINWFVAEADKNFKPF
jgi:hypothetical protein